MSDLTHLSFAIGPVQGFVAQSRRTRDLWGSSYLLSFLAGHAMRGAASAGARIVRPRVDEDPLFLWICGKGSGHPPRIGSLPNQFVVELPGPGEEAARVVARKACAALSNAWSAVCKAVWEEYVAPAEELGRGTRKIWDRQIGGFWEVAWAAGPESARDLMARRKLWRTHRLPEEPGDKCTVMPDLQELSGHVRSQGREARERQDAFWDAMRRQVGSLDLADRERLSAIALIKRLYPRVAEEALGWPVDRTHWPSTAYVAAVPWIRRVVEHASAAAEGYAEKVAELDPECRSGWPGAFTGLNDSPAPNFVRLDGNLFHGPPTPDDADPGLIESAKKALRQITESTDGEGRALGPAPRFFALLLADGDRLGRVVADLGGQRVGRALTRFTREVPGIVRRHDGVTVYAGGDDVLAMLPVEGALACAQGLAEAYAQAFDGAVATLSAAVTFVPIRFPLAAALAEAHRLLDDVAKDGNGRNSLAVAALKSGGLHSQWVSTWIRRGPEGEQVSAVEALDAVVQDMRKDVKGERTLSSSFVYRLRDTLGLLCGWHHWQPGRVAPLPAGLDLDAFVLAELVRTLDEREPSTASRRFAQRIVALLRSARNSSEPGGNAGEEVGFDALLLARFLAGGAQEDDR